MVFICIQIFMAPAGSPLALLVTVLWFLSAWRGQFCAYPSTVK
jgi:hypothetical protein